MLDLEIDCGEDERVESATKECSFPNSISKMDENAGKPVTHKQELNVTYVIDECDCSRL